MAKILRLEIGRQVYAFEVPEETTPDTIRQGLPDAVSHDKRVRDKAIDDLVDAFGEMGNRWASEHPMGLIQEIAERLKEE